MLGVAAVDSPMCNHFWITQFSDVFLSASLADFSFRFRIAISNYRMATIFIGSRENIEKKMISHTQSCSRQVQIDIIKYHKYFHDQSKTHFVFGNNTQMRSTETYLRLSLAICPNRMSAKLTVVCDDQWRILTRVHHVLSHFSHEGYLRCTRVTYSSPETLRHATVNEVPKRNLWYTNQDLGSTSTWDVPLSQVDYHYYKNWVIRLAVKSH